MMFASPTHWHSTSIRITGFLILTVVCGLLGSVVAFGQAQSNAADLQGFVRDPQGAVVVSANVTARNPATNFSRTVQTNNEGYYLIVSLPPGDYEVTVEASGYKKTVVPSYTLTVGARADLDVALEVGQISEVVNITTGDQPVIETSRTTVSNTIEQQRIQNLPINQRDYLGFATTMSSVNRGNDRPIGPAPSSGLNIGGQRGRSTLVQVDGADNTDNSVNASRSTVSQEAVQEFQVATNSYAPEFGRATGGIINVVTKAGTNTYQGNVFGFLRHRSFQARNAFAPIANPPFTRAQYGATFGGPIKKNRTFFFAAFEQRRRQESGFFTSNVGAGLTSSITIPAAILGLAQTFDNLTGPQAAFIGGELASGDAARIGRAVAYAHLASVGGQTALNGFSTLRNFLPGIGIPQGQVIGARFLLAGTPLPTAANNGAAPGFTTIDALGRPVAFRPLNQLARIFPISEATTFFSVRGDHSFSNSQLLTMRFGYNPSDLTGIQDESQNQTLGQNDFSRTGIQTLRDTSFVTSLNSTISSSLINEARFSYSKRHATFDSQVPGGPALQISGAAFMGPNPFSPVDRTEKRFQLSDNLNWLKGNHAFKFGADVNFINVNASFKLNFPGLFNFGELSAGTLAAGFIPGLSPLAPSLTPVQTYGIGVPSTFIQGFGNPISSIKNRPLAFFAQDSWKMRPNLTVNYGVRYDVELTDTIAPIGFQDPLTGIQMSAADFLAAQDSLRIQQGFPRDTNNFAPRIGAAWDINNDGKTVVRAAYGLFYDHPLLAIAFNSDIADAAQQQQYTNVLPGLPTPTASFNVVQIFQGTVCSAATSNPFCAALPAGFTTPGVARTAQYLPGRLRFNDQTFVGFGPLLPFTLNVAKSFEYAYANQANLSVEHQVGKNMSLSASYLFVGAHHLPHPEDINSPRTDFLIENFRRFAGRAPLSNAEALFGIAALPTACPGAGCPPGYTVIIPGLLGRNGLGQGVVSPIAANFFRPNGPNYFFIASATGGLVNKAAFDAGLAAANSLRTPGLLSPFADVSAQLSDGNSSYNALNLELKRRFANNFQFMASYTWSHSIDDSSDLQTLLKPQDNRNFRAERADSLFDQRHRFVFSGVWSSPGAWRSSNGARRFLSGFTVAPILEISSGRPFNIITGTETNGDLQSSNDRPSVTSTGVLFAPTSTPFTNGTLGRNAGITHGYASLDLRVSRAIRFGERYRLDIIAEGFNLFNRFNEAGASPFFSDVNAFGQRAGNGRYYSRPTAAYDSRQFQFGLKLNF